MNPKPIRAETVRHLASTQAGTAELVTPPAPEPTYADKLRASIRQGNDVLNKPRTSWLVGGWIPERSVGLVYGAPGSGKSFYALTLALELARGGRWVGQPLEAVRVLYVAAERAEVLGDRQEAWVQHHGQPIPDNFYELAAAPSLRNVEAHTALCAIVRELRPALVVVDTLARVTTGVNENDGTEWGEVARALGDIRDATDGGTVLAVHHSGKDATRGARGHTVLLGEVDYTLEMVGDSTAYRVRVDKLNAAAKPADEWYRLDPLLLPPLPGELEHRSGAVMVSTTGKVAGETRSGELLGLLAGDYVDTGMSRADVQEALGVSKNTAAKAVAVLRDRGYVSVAGKGAQTRYHLTEVGREAVDTA